MNRVVTYAALEASPRELAALSFLLDAAGLPARSVPSGEPAMLAYGQHPLRQGGIRIPMDRTARHWPELAAGRVSIPEAADQLSVDLVSLVAAHLDDSVNAALPPTAFDDRGRLRAEATFAATVGMARTPLVNRAVALVRELATDRFGIKPIPPWPSSRVAAVGLSHDVDLPERYALLRGLLRPWRFRRAPRTLLTAASRLARERLADPAPDDHWAFEELVAREAAAGVRSTFLFSVTPYHARHASTLDPAYDADRPRYRRLYERLARDGWEIGLHASYLAHRDPARLSAERTRLSEIAGVEVRGVRHHYWQLGPDPNATLRAHELAGFDYDASLAFNDAPGYRRSVALPFHPYDTALGRPIRTLQLPTTLMDGNLFYRPMTDADAVAETVAQIEVVRSLRGLAVIDWHSHTAVSSNRRFEAWGRAYEQILRWLAAERSLWVAPLGEIARWHAERSATLRRMAEAG